MSTAKQLDRHTNEITCADYTQSYSSYSYVRGIRSNLTKRKIDALLDVALLNPKFTVLIIGLVLVAAVLEGVGLSLFSSH